MRRLPKFAGPEQIRRHRSEWADYTRKRNRPTKECRTCKTEYPNDNRYFARGESGWLSSTCHACFKKVHTVPHGNPPRVCPVCHDVAVLVYDRKAPAELELCRRCLVMLNTTSDRALFDRFTMAQFWRCGWPAATMPHPGPEPRPEEPPHAQA